MLQCVLALGGNETSTYPRQVPYCPGEAPMDAQRRCLNGSTISEQVPTLDVKLATRKYLHHCFTRVLLRLAQQCESCIVLESRPTRSLVTKLLQCLSLAVCEFCAAGEKHCE